MKNNSLQQIKNLIKDLPPDDIKRAERFIKIRDFESLILLVKSAIKNIHTGINSVKPNIIVKYKDYILNPEKRDSLDRLLAEAISYKEMLDRIFDEDEDNGDSFYEYYNPDDFSEEDII